MKTQEEWVLSSGTLARRTLGVLLSTSLALALLDLLLCLPGRGWDDGARNVFNLAREDGLGNWYATVLWFAIALVTWAIALRQRSEGLKDAGLWVLAACLFTYASLDDGSRLHESLGGAFHRHIASANWFPSYTWHLVFGPIFAILTGVIAHIALQQTQTRFARWALLGGLTCLMLAVGMDLLEGSALHNWLGLANSVSPNHPIAWHLLKACEETIETAGLAMLLVGFLSHAAFAFPNWKIQFTA